MDRRYEGNLINAWENKKRVRIIAVAKRAAPIIIFFCRGVILLQNYVLNLSTNPIRCWNVKLSYVCFCRCILLYPNVTSYFSFRTFILLPLIFHPGSSALSSIVMSSLLFDTNIPEYGARSLFPRLSSSWQMLCLLKNTFGAIQKPLQMTSKIWIVMQLTNICLHTPESE